MLHDPISSTTLMSFSPSASDSSKSTASSPTLMPSHAIGLLDIDRSNPGSPAIAALVSSGPTSVSPIEMSYETAKPMPPAPSSNATHQKGQTGMNGGRWTEQEHQSFLGGLQLYGREWKKVAAKIKTRTSAQIRSHAQKYFAKLARDDELRKNSEVPIVIPGSVGYFSDGGSSIAQNSGDDYADQWDAQRQMTHTRSITKAKGTATALTDSIDSAASGLYKSTPGITKKRSRATVAGYEGRLGKGVPTSTYPYKFHKRSNDVTQAEGLPSQEELLAKASPNLRHRLSSLIEAELCALQVLSCIAVLQQQDASSAPRQKARRPNRFRKLATATTAATGSTTVSSLGLFMSTEQIQSTSSIY